MWCAAVRRMDGRIQARQVQVECKIRNAISEGRWEISLEADQELVRPLGAFNGDGKIEYSDKWKQLLNQHVPSTPAHFD